MANRISIDIASLPDREKLVAELFVGTEQFAELNTESGEPLLVVYPRQNGQPWRLSYPELLEALSHAKQRLVG